MTVCEKKYLSIEDRIKKLNIQGLRIDSESYFQRKVNEIGYYKLINGYRDVFLNKAKCYYEKTRFSEIVSVFDFDNNLKTITLKMICDLEINMKSLISELFSKKYGIDDSKYFQIKNFDIKDTKVFSSFKSKMLKEKNKIVKHYNDEQKIENEAVINYHSKYKIFPLYIIFKTASFGNMSIFYSNMKAEDKISIAKNFNIPSIYLQNYLKNINFFRNVCAHNERLFTFKTQNAIRMKLYSDYYKKLKIVFNKDISSYNCGMKDFFSLQIMLKLLTPYNKYKCYVKQVKNELRVLKTKVSDTAYRNVMHRLGFVNNWYRIVNFNK